MLMKVMVIDRWTFPFNNKVQKLLAPPAGTHPETNNPKASEYNSRGISINLATMKAINGRRTN